MEKIDITKLTALRLGEMIRAGEVSAVEAVEQYLRKIEEKDGQYHAYVTVWKEQALRRVAEVEREIEADRRAVLRGEKPHGKYAGSPLAGVPIAIKDNICTRGEKTTCGSRMLEDFKPPYDAEVIRRLEEAGMIILGKTNMDEFAMGSTTETSAAGVTRNPWNTEYVPGGSSGGSAVAVAAGLAPVALGSDTGGSVRQPASFCGVLGLKPTYGTVSRYGLIAYASSLDQIGPIARNVDDLEAVLAVISGRDEKDSTSVDVCAADADRAVTENMTETDGTAVTENSVMSGGCLSGLRVGIPKGYFGKELDPEVSEAVLAAAENLRKLGAETEEFELSAVGYAVPAYYVIASAEASSNLSRYDGVKYGFRAVSGQEELSGTKKQSASDTAGLSLNELYVKTRSEGFGEEVKRRMMIGTFVLSAGFYDAYYKKAQRVRGYIRQEFDRAFEKYDILLGPTAPTTAPKLGESLPDPLKMYLGDIYTVAVNLTGLPAVSVPCGFDQKGLPIGVQLIGRAFEERTLLRAAKALPICDNIADKTANKATDKAADKAGKNENQRKIQRGGE